jgi:hypothetical protein
VSHLADDLVAIKTRWVEALRSGRYAQGTGALRKQEAFCCLGVLCDVTDRANWEAHPSGIYQQIVHGGDSLLPEHVALASGVPHEAQWALANMNDMGRSFAEIADYIEAHL